MYTILNSASEGGIDGATASGSPVEDPGRGRNRGARTFGNPPMVAQIEEETG